MAHEIHSSDRFAETRKNGNRAWHGLGVEIEEGLTAVQGFQQVGLDWETELAPLYAMIETADGPVRIPVEESVAHIRRDDRSVLGVVGAGYQPIGNKELAEFADALAGLDRAIHLETAGSLRSGRKVFACVRLPKDIHVTDEDVLRQYVLVSNSHDGSAAFQCYPTSIRVVCANTLRWSEKDAGKGIRFRHTGDVRQKIEFARQALGIVVKETERFEAMVMALKAVQLDRKSTRAYMLQVYEACFGEVEEVFDGDDKAKVQAFERREKIVGEWELNLQNERQQLSGIRGTAWAAYNAISEWQDHGRGRFASITESEARVHSNLWGVSSRQKKQAFQLALSYA